MPGKSYKYKDFYPDLHKGNKKTIAQLEKIEKLIRKTQNIKSTGAGLKKTNQLYNESAQIQTKILKIGKLQKQRIKEVNAERKKELNLNKRNKDALNLKLQTEKQELAIKKKLITNQARLNAQKKLGVRANKGLMASINNLITRLGILAAAYLGMQTLRQSIELFKIQEQAVADNVTVFGDFSEVLQKFAADVQKVTTVGDEQTIALTTQAKNMGIVNEKVIEATRGTIGLAEKFKKAGLGQETALKGIALAYQGNFSQLERYIPALRNAETEAEKMTILQNEMTVGFQLATEAAKTQTGQLEQMSNEFGDIQEELGKELIPIIVKMSRTLLDSIKGWKLFFSLFRDQLNPETAVYINNLKESLRLEDARTKRIKIGTERGILENKLLKERNLLRDHKTFLGIDDAYTKAHQGQVEILKEQIEQLDKLRETESFFKIAVEETTVAIDDNTEALKKAEKERLERLEKAEKAEKERFKSIQELELSRFLLITDNDKKISEFKIKQNIALLEYEIQFNKDLSDIQKEALKNRIKLLEIERAVIIESQLNLIEEAELVSTTENKVSLLEKLFGTDSDLKTVQKRFQSISQTASNFLTALDNQKDVSLKKERRRKKLSKGIDLTSAIINTAVAVTDTVKNTDGGLLVKILAGLGMAAFGGSQVALIAGKEYFKGTEYLEFGNYKRGRDTIPFMGPDGSINMASGGERIVDTKINKELGGFPNPMLPTAVNYYRNAISQNNNINVERLLSEQNKILRNTTDTILFNNVIYEVKDGTITGKKTSLKTSLNV